MPEKYIKTSECEKYFYEHLDNLHMTAAMNAIDEMPNADVVDVIHCKNCRYVDDGYIGKLFCKMYLYNPVSANDYCSWGEPKDTPTADVAPIRHGHWIEQCEESLYSCSACGAEWVTIEGTPKENDMDFCPHCGAKMDGGDEE